MFLVSAPIRNCPKYRKFRRWLIRRKFGTFSRIDIPNFREVTDTELQGAMKTAKEMDDMMQNLFNVIIKYSETIRCGQSINLLTYLVKKKLKIGKKITDFTWNSNKYSIDLPLTKLCDKLCWRYQQLYEEFVELQDNPHEDHILNINLQETLAERNLIGLVAEELVIETRFYETVFVVVPVDINIEWDNTYVTIHESILENSLIKVAEDNIHKLYSVMIIRGSYEQFERKCQALNLISRKYRHQPRMSNKQMQEQIDDKIEWLKFMFEEFFDLYLHIKIIRAFSETFWRYSGEPLQMIMYHPINDMDQQLQDDLKSIYSRTASKNAEGARNSADIHRFDEKLFFLYKIDLDFPQPSDLDFQYFARF